MTSGKWQVTSGKWHRSMGTEHGARSNAGWQLVWGLVGADFRSQPAQVWAAFPFSTSSGMDLPWGSFAGPPKEHFAAEGCAKWSLQGVMQEHAEGRCPRAWVPLIMLAQPLLGHYEHSYVRKARWRIINVS